MSTRVVVVDDIEDLRSLLRATLDADGRFEVVGEAGDGREAVTVIDLTRPDVVVLDLHMPVMDGLEAAVEIAKVSPETKILIHSAFGDHALATVRGGGLVVSYLQKGARAGAIRDAVALAAAN